MMKAPPPRTASALASALLSVLRPLRRLRLPTDRSAEALAAVGEDELHQLSESGLRLRREARRETRREARP
jgi:hypothetical protein